MKVLVATEKAFAPAAVQGIRSILLEAGHDLLLLENYTDKAQLLEAIASADALIFRSDNIDSQVLEAAAQLKIAVRAGAGYDNIDLSAATARRVVVMNTPGQNANAVAELVFALLLYHLRKHFDGRSGGELLGRRLGLLAYGNVGKRVARIARAMGMEVAAYDFFGRVERIESDGTRAYRDRQQLVAESDIVSLHMPATPETTKIVNRSLLQNLPKGAILVNTARKEVVDEQELLDLFSERTDLSYLTDVRPVRHDEFVERLGERYFAPPKKMGAQTAEANMNAGLAAARQICDFFATGCTNFQVNKF
ncbi:MAG: NAD(P)-dependent oxidoreductase [Bacteroidales bacterium]|nr:NAD(P)-dependent oxidoreductase [Bacteroidales bacterium]